MAARALPEYAAFDPEEGDASTLPTRWEEWLYSLEIMIAAMGVTDHDRKWNLLNHYSGTKCQKIIRHLPYDKLKNFGPGGNAPAEYDHYRALKEALTLHFAPKKNIVHATFVFHNMKLT